MTERSRALIINSRVGAEDERRRAPEPVQAERAPFPGELRPVRQEPPGLLRPLQELREKGAEKHRGDEGGRGLGGEAGGEGRPRREESDRRPRLGHRSKDGEAEAVRRKALEEGVFSREGLRSEE